MEGNKCRGRRLGSNGDQWEERQKKCIRNWMKQRVETETLDTSGGKNKQKENRNFLT